jgi:hypothetical protein
VSLDTADRFGCPVHVALEIFFPQLSGTGSHPPVPLFVLASSAFSTHLGLFKSGTGNHPLVPLFAVPVHFHIRFQVVFTIVGWVST